MVSVVVALVVGLTGALAGLLPSILRSARRRMLHLMREEQELLATVKDEQAAEDLRQALRVTASRYRMWVAVPPYQRTGVLLGLLFPYYVAVAVVVVTLVVANSLLSDGERSNEVFQYAVLTFLAVTGVVMVVISLVTLLQSTNELESVRLESKQQRERFEGQIRKTIRDMETERESLVADNAPDDELAELDARLEEARELLADVLASLAELKITRRGWWQRSRK